MADDDVLEQVRTACRAVAERARFVRIDHDVLGGYPQRYETDTRAEPKEQLPTREGGDEATAALVLQLDAINFGSGWHPVLDKDPGVSGARTVAGRWRRWVEHEGVMAAGELMRLYARSLAELGCHLLGRYGGSFVDFVAAARHSAAALASALAELPMWRDVAEHDGLTVPFYKRAQIVCADLARAFAGEGPGQFGDLDRLTLFADNLVPHVLRVDGVLVFDDGLVRRIERGELLPAGSPEEVEIRAVGVHAVELLAAAWTAGREAGGSHEPWSIDEILWFRGAAPPYKAGGVRGG